MSLRRASINPEGFGYAIFWGLRLLCKRMPAFTLVNRYRYRYRYLLRILKFVKFNYTHGNPSTAALRWNYSLTCLLIV